MTARVDDGEAHEYGTEMHAGDLLKLRRQGLSCSAALTLSCCAGPAAQSATHPTGEPSATHPTGELTQPRQLASASPSPNTEKAPALAEPALSAPSAPPALDSVRACVARDSGAKIVLHPQPLYEAGDYNQLLAQIRRKPSQLNAKAARAALCRVHPDPALCASSNCERSDTSFIWLIDSEFEFRAALIVHGADGILRAYLAASGYTFSANNCLSAETHKPNCSESGLTVDRSDPTSAHVTLSYFATPGRFCNTMASDQTWIFDDSGRAIVWFIGTPRETAVTVSEGQVSVANRSARCEASAPLSDFLSQPPSSARQDYF